jgi:hypothetical protein
VNGWVGTAQGAALFMQWTRNGNDVSGSLVETNLNSSNSSKTDNYNESFKGTVSGSSVTLTFSGVFGSSSNLSGTLQDTKLILSFPQKDGSIQTVTMNDGTIDQYNQDVSSLTSQAQSNAQASAKASADAAIQKRIAGEHQDAADALATLQKHLNFTSMVDGISKDAARTAADLQRTRTDAAQGQGDYCLNASATVHNDAAASVSNDVNASLSNDVAYLKNAISTVNSDIGDLQAALSTLAADKGDAPAGAQDAIDKANAAVASATDSANQSIDQANADLVAAYAVANGLATGACAGQGPGKPPAPLAHIG